ncbi:MAG: PstS family phosphate ABC transporter substrate-binding protein [Hormoscilla sp. GUM202]|nr:PstS family phosphate ABC transporter substrate-binding protein [Hormoscilla sp. GUM202]
MRIGFLAGVLFMTATACGGNQNQTSTIQTTVSEETAADWQLTKYVLADGSSTVFPIAEAMAQKFMKANPVIGVTVGISSSGVGFKKFCIGDTDISNASRPIKKSEMALCEANKIEYVEIPVAFDAIAVSVNRDNDWTTCLTPQQLDKIWEPAAEGEVVNWQQIDEEYPDVRLGLYGAEIDSGTYDYFTDATTGEEGKSRSDYTASPDDIVTIQGIESEYGSLGFLTLSSYEKNKDALKLIAIENESGECTEPSAETIANGTYNPLARPLFLYINKESLEKRPAVKAFVEYLLNAEHKPIISEAGYLPLPDNLLPKVRARLDYRITGSMFADGSSVGVNLAEKLQPKPSSSPDSNGN